MARNGAILAVALITLLLIVSAGLAAGSIMNTYAVDHASGIGDGPDIEDPSNGPPGTGLDDDPDRSDDLANGDPDAPELIPQICVEALESGLVVAGIVAFILGVTALTYLRVGFTASMFVFYILGLPALLAYGVLTQCGPPLGNGEGGLDQIFADTIGDVGGTMTTVQPPLTVVIGVTLLFALVAIAALLSATGSQDIDVLEPPTHAEPADLERFARAAGRAADRIEQYDADVDNAVYEAWAEMTGVLAIESPETASPREFAGAAVDAGMHAEDVEQLTTLFEEVRYGNMDAEPREQLAVDTLRSIQSTYGTDPDEANE